MYQFHSLFSFLSLFLDQKPTTKLTWVLPTTSICYICYPPSLNNHKELGIAIYFVVQRNMYVCLMERYFIFCKNDFGLSNIFDPAQSKVSDPAKNARKPIIYCVLVKIFLRTNLIYKDFCLACNFGIPREKKIMMMFGFAVLVKSWIQH